MSSKQEPVIWHAYEYVYREKNTDWYWAVTIIAVSMSITAVLFNNILFAIFILLAFFTLMMHSKRKPHLLQVKLDDRGISEGRAHYHYSTIESFWVEDRYGEARLILKSKKRVLPYIIIPIADVTSDTVRDHVKKYLTEEEHTEPLAKQIMESLGF